MASSVFDPIRPPIHEYLRKMLLRWGGGREVLDETHRFEIVALIRTLKRDKHFASLNPSKTSSAIQFSPIPRSI